MVEAKRKNYLAKTDGTLLADHIKNLLNQAKFLFEKRDFVLEKYRKFTNLDLRRFVIMSACWHDEGKKDDDWQSRCLLDFEEWEKTPEHLKYKFQGKNLRQVQIRHEMASLQMAKERGANLTLPVEIAIASHHSKLSRRERFKQRWFNRKEFAAFWFKFNNLSANVEDRNFRDIILSRFCFAGVRSWLQLIDHRASAYEQGEELPDFNSFTYDFPYKSKRGVQKIIEQLWDEPFAILRSPTGSGKTDAALVWAEHQCKQGRADRVIFAMPTRFTANALSISKANDISEVGLYHSSALFQKLQTKNEKDKKFINKEQELARKLEMPCVVTTLDHLCISLTGTREDHHSIFFGLANSCVVIDEADFYDEFTQANLIVLLKVLKILKVPILLMSATVPESAKGLYSQAGFSNVKIFEDKTNYEVIRCKIKRSGKAEKPKDISDLLEKSLNGEPTIIYANTVKRSQEYYLWFKERLKSENHTLEIDDVILYHSKFIESDKLEKETELVKRLGKNAWQTNNARGVAILTQIGEMSVNISADLMISDLCPIDRLAQRAGRLSRFENRGDGKTNIKGELHIIRPYHKKNGTPEFYPAPYGEYKNGWIPSKYLELSDKLLIEGEYSAKDFVNLVDKLYPEIENIKPHTRQNKENLKKMIKHNWLILPAEEVDKDADSTTFWQCRDIPPMNAVQVEESPSNFIDEEFLSFRNKTELRQWENSNTINIYPYEFSKAIEDEQLTRVSIPVGYDQDNFVDKYIVNQSSYNKELGLFWGGSNAIND